MGARTRDAAAGRTGVLGEQRLPHVRRSLARRALLVRTGWNVAEVTGVTQETQTARTLRLRLPGLTGHRAGQHVDVRLTAPDGYTAVRSYSVASALPGDELDLTVEELADG